MRTKVCPICGNTFKQRSNRQKYCSEKCRRKANANIDNTKAHNKSLPIGNKYKIYLAYDCKCAICGWRATNFLWADDNGLSFGYGNEIHHIEAVSEGGNSDDGNIILLCPNCHKLAHMNLIHDDRLKKNTKPIRETCEQKAKEFRENSRAPEIIMDYLKADSPSDELIADFVKIMQYADLIARAGYMKLNSIWRGWVDTIEDGAKHYWISEDDKD